MGYIHSSYPTLVSWSNCKCYFTPTIKSSGLPFKTCDKCRTKDKEARQCEHGKRKSKCIPCGGNEICEHKKEKYKCKQCGGNGICEHNKVKADCKDCGGSKFCEHGRPKTRCVQCKGTQICEHNKRKSDCKECKPNLVLARCHSKQIKKF